MTRGDLYPAPGLSGLYVGTRGGVDWVAWEHWTFRAMCKAFDEAAGKRVVKRGTAGGRKVAPGVCR